MMDRRSFLRISGLGISAEGVGALATAQPPAAVRARRPMTAGIQPIRSTNAGPEWKRLAA
jgi:hypothetical protein